MNGFLVGCAGCDISQGVHVDVNQRGGIVELDGNWILNHYGGSEGFLGWMALQPRFHRMELADLTPEEAAALGSNIQKVEAALRQYWLKNFPSDPIQRMYVVYFFESIFDPKPDKYHLHLHLIPRTVRLGRLLRRYSCDGSIHAWSVSQIVILNAGDIPDEYKNKNHEKPVLMTYLRACLAQTRAEK